MTTQLPIDDTTNHWKEDENTYSRKEDSKGNSDNNGTYETYVKRIVDISGKNNHLYIGPYKNYHVYNYDASKAWLDPDNEYYGSNRPYTFYESGTKLGPNSNEGNIPTTHPDHGLPRKLRGHDNYSSNALDNYDISLKDGIL